MSTPGLDLRLLLPQPLDPGLSRGESRLCLSWLREDSELGLGSGSGELGWSCGPATLAV